MNVKWAAFVRAVRTFVQGLLATVAAAVVQAVYVAMEGGQYNPKILVTLAVGAAVTAVVTYLYNLLAPAAPEAKPKA